jgi:hypothetical protein
MAYLKEYLRYFFLVIGLALFIFLVLKDLIRAIYLKSKGTRAYGTIVRVNTLPGRNRLGQDHKSIHIQVKHEGTTFTFECLHTQVPSDVYGKIPVVFIRKENAPPICDIDSWTVLLTDAILWMIVSLCLVAGYFLMK